MRTTVLQKAAKGGAKKPLSGFMLFSKEHRAQVKKDDPELSVSAWLRFKEPTNLPNGRSKAALF